MTALLKNSKFWLAVVGVIQSILLQVFTELPPSIWQSIDVLIAVVIVALTGGEITMELKRLNVRFQAFETKLKALTKGK